MWIPVNHIKKHISDIRIFLYARSPKRHIMPKSDPCTFYLDQLKKLFAHVKEIAIQNLVSFSHSVIQSFSHSVILSFCHSVILSFSHSVIQSFSHSVTSLVVTVLVLFVWNMVYYCIYMCRLETLREPVVFFIFPVFMPLFDFDFFFAICLKNFKNCVKG